MITFIEFMKIHMNLNFREDRRKKEVEDLISKYAKKKDKDEVMTLSLSLKCTYMDHKTIFLAAEEWE